LLTLAAKRGGVFHRKILLKKQIMITEKMPLENENEPSCLGAVSGSVTDKPKIIIIGDCSSGHLAATILALSKNNDVEIVASIQDVKNQMSNDYFAKESLKLKCFDLPPLVELRDKKGNPLELPKSKYHR
jgi:hypothetical protein